MPLHSPEIGAVDGVEGVFPELARALGHTPRLGSHKYGEAHQW